MWHPANQFEFYVLRFWDISNSETSAAALIKVNGILFVALEKIHLIQFHPHCIEVAEEKSETGFLNLCR